MSNMKSIGTKQGLNQSLALKQVGANPIKIRGKTYFKIGGGVFTKKEVLRSRLRYGKTMGVKVPKESVGL